MDSSVFNFCRRFQSLAKVFRFVELCILLVLLSWLSTRLPFAVKISSEYFRKLVTLIFSPIVIFCLGNAIVVTLFVKSGLFSGESPLSVDNAVAEMYEEFRSENTDEIAVLLKEEVVFQDKEIICEENNESPPSTEVIAAEKRCGAVKVKAEYRRSQSEKTMRESELEKYYKSTEKLRRSETDMCRKSFARGGDEVAVAAIEVFPADVLSDDEFNRTIEAFIAKQVTFHRKERLSVVLHGQA